MSAIFTTSTVNFFYFLIAGSTIVYLILKFDKANRKKLSKVLVQAKDVQPMLMKKSAEQKLHTLKAVCREEKNLNSLVEKQLDELVAEYDSGQITLPDYCKKLNSLLAMTA